MLREARLVLSVRHKQEVRYELNTSVLQDLVQHVTQLVDPGAATRPAARKGRRLGERPQEA